MNSSTFWLRGQVYQVAPGEPLVKNENNSRKVTGKSFIWESKGPKEKVETKVAIG